MLWGSVGWFPVHWGGIRFGWRTSEMVRFILDISPHDYILSASIQKCLLIDFHHSPIREALQKPVITTSLFISGVWAYDLETIRRRSWTGRAAGVFFKQKVWSKMSLANFWFFSFFFVVDFLTKKEKASWQAGRSSWSFFGSLAARGSHFTFTSSLCVSLTSWSQVYDFFVIGSSHKSHSHGTGLWHWDEERRFGNPASTAKESTLLRWNRVARRRKFQGSERLLGGFQRYHWDHSGPKKENQLLPKPSENAYKVKEADFASDLYRITDEFVMLFFC